MDRIILKWFSNIERTDEGRLNKVDGREGRAGLKGERLKLIIELVQQRSLSFQESQKAKG